jgi:hypothetical protein
MNRCKFFFKTMVVATAFLLGSLALSSCKKHDPVVTLDNVVDTAPADKLKSAVTSATKLADLPPAFTAAAQTVINDNQSAVLFDAVDFNAAAQFVQANSVLTAAEVTKLKANDPYTLNVVITRMTSLPSYISESTVSAVYDNMLNNAELSTYVIHPESPADPLYENNSYQCALDVQKLIRDYTIPMLQKLATLKAGGKKSASFNRSGGVLSAGIWGFLRQLRKLLEVRIHIG